VTESLSLERGKIGIVTVTFNSGDVLDDFLDCLAKQSFSNFVLFAIDNASSDKTLERLSSRRDPRIWVVANPDNRGVAEGNNQGIRAALEAGCDAVLLINNDTVFGPPLLAQLAQGMDKYRADMTCPKMMYFDEPERFWAAGGAFQRLLGYRIKHLGGDQIDRGQFDQVTRVTYVPTCCVLIRSALFHKIGLMDPQYFVYMDDVDFMYRALRAGASLIYLPHASLLHKAGQLTGGNSAFSVRFAARNRIYFMRKHFGPIMSLPWIFTYAVYFCLRFLSGKDDFAGFRLRQKSLLEGCRMRC
jgi:GT2 family glycosyltransferase